jgi:flagellar P-ring protein precursor FlgI
MDQILNPVGEMNESASTIPMRKRPSLSKISEGMRWKLFLGWILLAALIAVAAVLAQGETPGQRARVKDVATIEGIRDNQLVGYGLVVGLRGTGDSSQTVFPAQTLISALERMGVTVPQTGSNSASNMQVKNMAAVFVVATLPPFSRPGYRVDITASSAGDARSLEGGILLMTPLYGPDGQIYAQAQGALVLGGYMSSAAGNTRQLNHRQPRGFQAERWWSAQCRSNSGRCRRSV